MPLTKEGLLIDPEILIANLIGESPDSDGRWCMDYPINKYMQNRTDEWKARGNSNSVRSSSLAVCSRQSYYSYFAEDVPEKEIDREGRKRMFLGQKLEDFFGEYLHEVVPGKVHTEQNTFPINIEHPDNTTKINFRATTDFVMELETATGTPAYIPIELKCTNLYKWNQFTYHDYHLEQLLLWVYYAKLTGINVPYAMLLYVHGFYEWYKSRIHKKVYDVKPIIISVDTDFKKLGRTIERFDRWMPYLDAKVAAIKANIKNKTLPELPKPMPLKYICESCAFRAACLLDRNTADKKKG